jgi:magnesium chelatase family protein
VAIVRRPHPASADAGIIGGSQAVVQGDGSLTHPAVLCPDALPACRRHVVEVLRQPLENDSTTKR